MSNIGINTDIDNVYYNAIIRNEVTNTSAKLAEFIEEHSQPIVSVPSDYKLTIVRMNIPADGIPLFFFQNGRYSITLSYGGDDYKEVLQYVSIVNPGLFPGQQPVYYYPQFIQSINDAFLAAHTLLFADHPSANPHPPLLVYDPNSQLLSFVVDREYIITDLNRTDIYMNTDLSLFFQNIEFYTFSRYSVSGKDVQLIVQNVQNNYYPNPTNPTVQFTDANGVSYNALQMTSEYPLYRKWNSIRGIVVTTTAIPVRREILATNSDGTPNPTFANVLTDFTPQINTNADVLTPFYYYPQGPYRLMDLVNDTPLYKFDYRISWIDSDGNLFPIYVLPGNEIAIKFLFMRKTMLNFFNAGGV